MCAFVTCPKQGLEMEAVVLHRVGFCPKQGQDFKPSAAPLYLNLGQVPPPPPGIVACVAGGMRVRSRLRNQTKSTRARNPASYAGYFDCSLLIALRLRQPGYSESFP